MLIKLEIFFEKQNYKEWYVCNGDDFLLCKES